jgi:hypothetical protein
VSGLECSNQLGTERIAGMLARDNKYLQGA